MICLPAVDGLSLSDKHFGFPAVDFLLFHRKMGLFTVLGRFYT